MQSRLSTTSPAQHERQAGFVLSMLLLNVAAGFRVDHHGGRADPGQCSRSAVPSVPGISIRRGLPPCASADSGPLRLAAFISATPLGKRLDLPAIFPDGRSLDRLLPWFTGQVARAHLKWLRNKRSPLVALEAALFEIILYWIVPATTILFWGRYLTVRTCAAQRCTFCWSWPPARQRCSFPGP